MARRHRWAAEHGAAVRRLVAAYAAADPATRAAGRQWYPAAEAIVREIAAETGHHPTTVAGVIAALSPQTRWRENIANAEAMLLGRKLPSPTYFANELKASRIVGGEHPVDVLGGPKVRSFFGNLIGAVDLVTVDVWAQRAATGRDLPAPKMPRYKRLARAYRAAAERCGEAPRDFQAMIWLAIRPDSEHTKDVQTIEAEELFA